MKNFRNITAVIFIFIQSIVFISCDKEEENASLPFPLENNPCHKIRKERMEKLLPLAMQRANVDSWIVICRENNNDPLALHIGAENAGGTAAFIYFLKDSSLQSVSVCPEGEADALAETGVVDTVIKIERGNNIWEKIKEVFAKYEPQNIAINSSEYSIADGLSYNQRIELEVGVGEKYSKRFVPSTDLANEWLSVKLPEEIEIMKKAAEITSQLQYEAYSIIEPGKTKDSDVAKFLKKRMKELGVKDGWAPDQNPNVNSGPDRGHSHATEKVIMPGDVIQTDFGIKVYDIWVTDIQRFAYVLKPGETDAPDNIKKYWNNAVKGHRKVLAAMKPGVTGWQVDKTQRDWMNETGSLSVIWGTGHPVGYWAHDAGPALSGASRSEIPIGNSARVLRPGQTFAYDGFYKWRTDNDTTKTISVEEMAVVTETGAEYMTAPQEKLILIKGK